MAEDILVLGRLWFVDDRFHDFAGDLVEKSGRMPFGLVFLRKFIPLALW